MIAAEGSSELIPYLPIVFMIVVSAAFSVLSMLFSHFLRPSNPTPAKSTPYECGIVPERLPENERYPVKFYLVAMLFIIFDIETIFLFPWAVAFRSLGVFGLVEMTVFIALVFVAYIYVWRRGGLDWEQIVVGARSSGGRVEHEAITRREVRRAG